MTVLGSHFLDVAAELQQFLVNYVAPMAECDPGMVRAHYTLVNRRVARLPTLRRQHL